MSASISEPINLAPLGTVADPATLARLVALTYGPRLVAEIQAIWPEDTGRSRRAWRVVARGDRVYIENSSDYTGYVHYAGTPKSFTVWARVIQSTIIPRWISWVATQLAPLIAQSGLERVVLPALPASARIRI